MKKKFGLQTKISFSFYTQEIIEDKKIMVADKKKNSKTEENITLHSHANIAGGKLR